ncbi:MAG: TrbI/VirB10 family protein [Acidobacteriaceae bacterium]
MPTSDEKVLLPDNNSGSNAQGAAAAKPAIGKGSGLLTKATTQKLAARIVVVVLVVLVGLVLISRKNVVKTKSANPRHPQANIGSVVKKTSPLISAPADKSPVNTTPLGGNDVTPQTIEMTRNPAVEAARKAQDAQSANHAQTYPAAQGSPNHALPAGGNLAPSAQQAKPLNLIHPFQKPADDGNGNWQPTPYSGQTPPNAPALVTQEEKRAYSDQVTKQSVTFTLSNQATAGGQPSGNDLPITNLGLEPGYHIGARTETSASSAEISVPVVAAIQYNYMRDGKVLIPAGSRAIGTMNQVNASGYAGLSFSSLQFPDGRTVPIAAVALDKNMMPIKGTVTGKNLAKQFLVATMAGLGEATAMVAGGSNMSGAYSQSDMIKQQAALNIGNAADSQIQMLNNGQHIVVTIPAGTEINVVFVKPTQTNKTTSH